MMSSFRRAEKGAKAPSSSSTTSTSRSTTSSFQKKRGIGAPSIPVGTTPSLVNGQLLTSTGVKSLDYLLKGGLAVGTVLAIESGPRSSYADVLLRYFLSEGICQSHHVTLLSADVDPSSYLLSCPKALDVIALPDTASVASSKAGEGPEMQIAWRYKNLPKVNAELGAGKQTRFSKKYQHAFTLSETVDAADLSREGVHSVDLRPKDLIPQSSSSTIDAVFDQAFAAILEAVEPFAATPNPGPLMSKTVHRICIHNLGSPAWWPACHSLTPRQRVVKINQFLLKLRGIARNACCVFCITFPDSLHNSSSTNSSGDEALARQLHFLTDVCLRMDGFAGTPNEDNQFLREYHGFFKVLNLGVLNSIVPLNFDTNDLAFKLKKNGLAIEKIHLPPELSETVSRSQEEDDDGRSSSKSKQGSRATKDSREGLAATQEEAKRNVAKAARDF